MKYSLFDFGYKVCLKSAISAQIEMGDHQVFDFQ